jgi:two-component system, NarL family, sensor histidine kinase UhpB
VTAGRTKHPRTLTVHDEVGQTMTGVMLQVEALAARNPDEPRDGFAEPPQTARSGTEDVRRIARQLRPERPALVPLNPEAP